MCVCVCSKRSQTLHLQHFKVFNAHILILQAESLPNLVGQLARLGNPLKRRLLVQRKSLS